MGSLTKRRIQKEPIENFTKIEGKYFYELFPIETIGHISCLKETDALQVPRATP